MNYKKCCLVLGCNSSEEIDSNTLFFRFPINKDSKRYKQWVAFTRNPEARSNTGPKYICSKHFESGEHVDEQNSKLIFRRVPTLYPPNEDEVYKDHVYSLPPLPNSPDPLFRSPPREKSPSPPPNVFEPLMTYSEDEEVTEILNEKQAQTRIVDLMVNVDTLTKENVKLLKENTAILLKNESLKKEIARWRAFSEAVIYKAGQNSHEDYSRYRKETDNLKRALTKKEKQLKIMQEEKSLFKEKLKFYMLEEDIEAISQEILNELMNDEPDIEEIYLTRAVDDKEENNIVTETHGPKEGASEQTIMHTEGRSLLKKRAIGDNTEMENNIVAEKHCPKKVVVKNPKIYTEQRSLLKKKAIGDNTEIENNIVAEKQCPKKVVVKKPKIHTEQRSLLKKKTIKKEINNKNVAEKHCPKEDVGKTRIRTEQRSLLKKKTLNKEEKEDHVATMLCDSEEDEVEQNEIWSFFKDIQKENVTERGTNSKEIESDNVNDRNPSDCEAIVPTQHESRETIPQVKFNERQGDESFHEDIVLTEMVDKEENKIMPKTYKSSKYKPKEIAPEKKKICIKVKVKSVLNKKEGSDETTQEIVGVRMDHEPSYEEFKLISQAIEKGKNKFLTKAFENMMNNSKAPEKEKSSSEIANDNTREDDREEVGLTEKRETRKTTSQETVNETMDDQCQIIEGENENDITPEAHCSSTLSPRESELEEIENTADNKSVLKKTKKETVVKNTPTKRKTSSAEKNIPLKKRSLRIKEKTELKKTKIQTEENSLPKNEILEESPTKRCRKQEE